MKNKKTKRMETLKANGLDTSKYVNLSLNIPSGSKVEIMINGKPYNISNDEIVKQIKEKGYVFNSRTDGRWVCAQTFRMFNSSSYNPGTNGYEYGWDAYLRNNYPYMYQFKMMKDELHKLAKMEQSNDPEFEKLSRFFTKDVVVETCKHYIKQLNKFIKTQKIRHCKGKPYVKLAWPYGDVFIDDLKYRIFNVLNADLYVITISKNYIDLKYNLTAFMKHMCKLPDYTPKCEQWKTAFKGKGAYLTLLNIVKFHGCEVINYETAEVLDRDDSVAYIENLLDTYHPYEYWKFHELLKATIKFNKFDLVKSIQK